MLRYPPAEKLRVKTCKMGNNVKKLMLAHALKGFTNTYLITFFSFLLIHMNFPRCHPRQGLVGRKLSLTGIDIAAQL
jgi:hypothetical protein